MLSDLLPLSRYAVDRDGDARADPGLLATLLDDDATRVVFIHRGLVAVTAGRDGLDLGRPGDVPRGRGARRPLLLAYLGRDEVGAYVACVLSETAEAEHDFAGVPHVEEASVGSRTWVSLREVGGALNERDAGLAVTAVALAAWHARHTRCPLCGEPTEPEHAGWVRRCAVDASQHHPRTDPAVIVGVTDTADRLLLAHAAHWPARRFSLVAGFVEPGESLEAAVRREVSEECGLRISDLTYVASQPWPFPSSLMLGFRARLAGGDLAVDGLEVTEARFVSRGELEQTVDSGEIVLPHRSSIARAMIEEWFGRRLPGA